MRFLNNIIFYFIVVTVLLFIASCSSETDDRGTYNSENVIRWGIVTEDDTRALISDDITLQGKCSIDGERIGVWANLEYKDGTNAAVPYGDVEFFKDVMLAYYNKPEGRDGKHWNYPGEDKFWVSGTYMLCRAYYPANFLKGQNEFNERLVELSSSASSFRIKYSTSVFQEDILVGYSRVDSDKKRYFDNEQKKIISFDSQNGIPLKMQHALTALQFQFVQDGGSENQLDKCWLESEGSDNIKTRFAVSANMMYGLKYEIPGDEHSKGRVLNFEDRIFWKKSYCPIPQEKIYYWVNIDGITIPYKNQLSESNPPATPYKNNYKDYKDTFNKEQKEYVTDNIYCNNDGFLLMIPQRIPENLYLCFTTKKGGPFDVIRIKIPEDKGGTEVESLYDHTKKEMWWLPNYRYTYTITISNSNITIDVGSDKWNNIFSNSSVDF